MKKDKIYDERIFKERRRINGEAYHLIMIFLLCSILVKQFILHAEFKEYAVEFVAFFGSSAYVIIRNIFVGNNVYRENKNSLPILNSIIIGASVTFTLVLLRFEKFPNINAFILESIMAFVWATLTSLLVYYIIKRINIKRIKYLENKYNDDE